MKVSAVLLGVTAGVAAVVVVAWLGGRQSAVAQPVTATPLQHVTLTVVNDGDQIAGSMLLLRPGRVVLTIVNHASHAHTFSAPALGVERVVVPGSSTHPTRTVIRFRAKQGWYPWFCRFPCEMGGIVYMDTNPPRIHGIDWANATT